MTNNFLYGGHSGLGYKRDNNEDYLTAVELDDETLLCLIADGSGSQPSTLQPAQIIAAEVTESLKRSFADNKKVFLDNCETFLREALLSANRTIGAFRIANEEIYSGFASSVSCCVLGPERLLAFAHSGNTRIYRIRVTQGGDAAIMQLTKDHTKGQLRVDKGELTQDEYYFSPDRLVIYSALGLIENPAIQTFQGRIRDRDFIVLTTDGIHDCVNANAIMNLVLASSTCEDAAQALTKAAFAQKYNDNGTALVIFKQPSN